MIEQRANFEDLRQMASDMVKQLRDSGVVPGVAVGETAPGFRLPNATGDHVGLADRLVEGPVVAISPQAPDDSLSFAATLELGFDVLSDLDQTVTKAWGLQFELPDALRDVYRSMDIDLETHNADSSWHLPVPATFVLDRDGVVRARHVDPNYRERMAVEDVVAALDGLAA